MPLGTFTLVIGGEQQDGTAENKARLHLLPQGVDTLIDADADEFKFPSKFAKATGEGISLSPTYELILFTDSTSGPSTTIGYKGYVATGNGGRVDFEFAAQQAGTTKALTDLTDEVIVPISSVQQYRDEAEAARDEAVAFAGVLPERFGAVGDGTTNDTAALTAWLASAPAQATLSPGKTYCTATGLSIPAGTRFDGQGSTIKATATIAGALLDTPVGSKHVNGVCRNVVLDCNNLAATGWYARWFANRSDRDITVKNPTMHGHHYGDPAAFSTSYGARAQNPWMTRDSTGAIPAGSVGLWYENATDGEVVVGEMQGAETSVRSETSGNRFAFIHAWGFATHTPTTCFDDVGGENNWIGCVADTPTTYGWRLRGHKSAISGGRAFNGPFGGLDNAAVAIHTDQTTPVLTVGGGFAVIGSDASHRWSKDFDSGDLSAANIIMPDPVNVVTTAGPAGQATSFGGIRIRKILKFIGNLTNAFNAAQADGTQLVNMNTTTTKAWDYVNGMKTRWYSDNFATLKAQVDATTGIGSFATGLEPTGAIAETWKRNGALSSQADLTSGTLFLAAISLPAGVTISNITAVSGNTALSGTTHLWFGLYDSSRVQLAVTADQTAATWATFAAKTLPIATVATGAASSFTTTYTGLYYVGILVGATTVPTLTGGTPGTAVPAIAPMLYGNSSTALTAPPAFPTTAGAITAINGAPYVYLS